jgi:hypothetical protein
MQEENKMSFEIIKGKAIGFEQMKTPETDTPETDKAYGESNIPDDDYIGRLLEMRDFARSLERKLAAARDKLERLESVIGELRDSLEYYATPTGTCGNQVAIDAINTLDHAMKGGA